MAVVRLDAHAGIRDPDRSVGRALEVRGHEPVGPPGLSQLRAELEREGIDGVILVQMLASIDETRYLLELAAADPVVYGVVGWVDLRAPDVGRQIAALRAGPRGRWLVGISHPVRHESSPDWLLDDAVRRGLTAVGTAGLVFDLDVSPRELPAAYQVCRELGGIRFVVDHLGSPPISSGDLSAWGGGLLRLAELPNVCAKISGLVTEADWHTWSIDDLRHPVELAVDAFGPERLMLGSDWPRCLLAGAYTDAIDACRYLVAELPPHEQDAIRGGTATRVYRLAYQPA